MYKCFLKEVISKQNTKDWIARENCVYSRTEWQNGVGSGERVERRGVMCKDRSMQLILKIRKRKTDDNEIK